MKQTRTTILILFFISSVWQSWSQRVMRQIMKDLPPILSQPFDADFHPDAKVLGQGLFSHLQPITELHSSFNNQFAGTENGNLYIRNAKSDNQLLNIVPKDGWYWHMDNAMWSPNGQYLIAKQIDDRKVKTIKLTHKSPEDISYKTYSKVGEPIPIHQFYIINITNGETKTIEQPSGFPYIHLLGFHDGNQKLHLVASNRFMKTLHLLEVDLKTGQSSILLTEQSDTFLIGLNLLQGYSKRLRDMNMVTFIDDKKQFIWMSERSGYKQLYLYDISGTLIRPLTSFSQNGSVERIVNVDLDNEMIYFLSHGNKVNLFQKQLYSTSLVSEKVSSVINSSGIVDLINSKNNDTLWVLRSELPKTLQLDRYIPSYNEYKKTWEGDFSQLGGKLFNYEYVKVQSEGNASIIETLLLKPISFDSTKNYPVVEYIYGAAHDNVVPHNLFSSWLWEMNDLAQEGFIVVLIDGRGTLGKSKMFLDYGYGHFGEHVIKEHISTIKQLASNRSYMNLDNVGIIGHSWGGYFALRALLEAPDFYKAGHINAAAVNLEDFRIPLEIYMGCSPQACPERYSKFRITDNLVNLKAPLMIVHGTADDDVPIDNAYNLIKTLKANGYHNYDFKEYQGMNHIVMRHPDWQSQMITFFIKHLN